MWEDGADKSCTEAFPHPLFPLKNANKFRENSNKLGKIGIN